MRHPPLDPVSATLAAGPSRRRSNPLPRASPLPARVQSKLDLLQHRKLHPPSPSRLPRVATECPHAQAVPPKMFGMASKAVLAVFASAGACRHIRPRLACMPTAEHLPDFNTSPTGTVTEYQLAQGSTVATPAERQPATSPPVAPTEQQPTSADAQLPTPDDNYQPRHPPSCRPGTWQRPEGEETKADDTQNPHDPARRDDRLPSRGLGQV
ncbi:hypothetical protein PHYSODRAFT_304999 [Phytophthora sojae]|uniref:Uncharacterized protein n=1 Tax=Phytophthora sojae (strain P6497) TaxID=1094619 RepID=G5A3X0_PHYSP|nr:hypothetical protein PHYSODRAFT_304999 [Phytophthora sojae]EGZ09470.1 hypothetical protein PHYSODRAFT_304999 [Phytophthora sojae]|eukprot:XP_009534331.1 hypothetical protein PHYSODRAFT_304999 [Phytophthora sojae]